MGYKAKSKSLKHLVENVFYVDGFLQPAERASLLPKYESHVPLSVYPLVV